MTCRDDSLGILELTEHRVGSWRSREILSACIFESSQSWFRRLVGEPWTAFAALVCHDKGFKRTGSENGPSVSS